MQAQAAIPERTIDGERTILVGPGVLVASKSKPGTWHQVENGECDCEGFSYRHTCRHLKIALLAHELDRAEARRIERPTCPRCNKRPVGVIAGKAISTCCMCALKFD